MKVVCYGDSNTYGYDPRSFFGESYSPENRWVDILSEKKGWKVINDGMNGREIPIRSVAFPPDTDLLIVMLGTNDLLQFQSPETACSKMEKFLEPLTLARKKILLIAPPPMKIGEWVQDQELIDDSITLAKHYQALAEHLGIHFADAGEVENISLAYDGVHLTEEAHRAFAEGVIKYLHKGE